MYQWNLETGKRGQMPAMVKAILLKGQIARDMHSY